MIVAENLKTYCHGQAKMLAGDIGDEIWDMICSLPPGSSFRTGQIVAMVIERFGYQKSTADSYSIAVLHNALLTQDEEYPSLIKLSHGKWQLVGDNS